MIDLNDAPEQRPDSVIPDGTFCGLKMTIRPGGGNIAGCSEIDLGLFKQSLTSDVAYLDCQFAVCGGPHKGRTFFQNMTVAGGKVGEDGVSKGWNITKSVLRAMVDSALQLDPKDMSEAAKAKRSLRGFHDFDGIEFFARLGIERGGQTPDGGQYPDKNRIAHIVVPGEPQYALLRAGQEVAPSPSHIKPSGSGGSAPSAPAQDKPVWQQDTAEVKPVASAGPSWLIGKKQ
jgi:hypothetical protein